MPAPLDAPWPAIQAHAIIHGLRETARAYGLSESTVMSRCAREGWLRDAGLTVTVQPLPASMQPRASGARTAPEAALRLKRSDSERSRTYAGAAIRKGMQAAARKDGDTILACAASISSLATAGAKVFADWRSDATAPVTVNIGIAGLDARPIIEIGETRKSLSDSTCQSQ